MDSSKEGEKVKRVKKFFAILAVFSLLISTSIAKEVKANDVSSKEVKISQVCDNKGCKHKDNTCKKDCKNHKKCMPKVEAYAHPTLFNSQVYQAVDGKSVYMMGEKLKKSPNKVTVKNKNNVLISSWAKDVLSKIKNQKPMPVGIEFNNKLPILRSELAVVLSEAFNLQNDQCTKEYSDINSSYWAKNSIYKALNSSLMIGYPDNTFKPDRPVTKAEVFAVVARIVDVPIDKSLNTPVFNNRPIKYIPVWAIGATKEVVGSQLLEQIPQIDKVNNDEYLSKEQVAYLIGALRYDLYFKKSLNVDKNSPVKVDRYTPVCIQVEIKDRVSAKHSNIGDKFKAKTLNKVCIYNKVFEKGSIVTGEVVEVNRPGINNCGFIKVKFLNIKNGDICAKFPENISDADAKKITNPNFIARILGAPFSTSARVVGVTGRTGAAIVNVVGNGLEKYGDELSNTFVETFSLEPVSGLRSFGSSFVTVGKGIFDITKLAVSGAFGVVYEVVDEVVYLVLPSKSNDSSLNPGETMNIIF